MFREAVSVPLVVEFLVVIEAILSCSCRGPGDLLLSPFISIARCVELGEQTIDGARDGTRGCIGVKSK